MGSHSPPLHHRPLRVLLLCVGTWTRSTCSASVPLALLSCRPAARTPRDGGNVALLGARTGPWPAGARLGPPPCRAKSRKSRKGTTDVDDDAADADAATAAAGGGDGARRRLSPPNAITMVETEVEQNLFITTRRLRFAAKLPSLYAPCCHPHASPPPDIPPLVPYQLKSKVHSQARATKCERPSIYIPQIRIDG